MEAKGTGTGCKVTDTFFRGIGCFVVLEDRRVAGMAAGKGISPFSFRLDPFDGEKS
jgi:hypothetical protein